MFWDQESSFGPTLDHLDISRTFLKHFGKKSWNRHFWPFLHLNSDFFVTSANKKPLCRLQHIFLNASEKMACTWNAFYLIGRVRKCRSETFFIDFGAPREPNSQMDDIVNIRVFASFGQSPICVENMIFPQKTFLSNAFHFHLRGFEKKIVAGASSSSSILSTNGNFALLRK